MKTLNELVELNGMSGDEKDVSAYLHESIKNYCDDIIYDKLGSLFALKRSKKENAKKVMLCTHMDEVGLMVTQIRNDGLIEFIKIGEIDDQVLISSRVESQNKKRKGVVIAEEESKNMLIDFGFDSKEDAENNIHLGDSIVFEAYLKQLNQSKIMGKNLESRIGCSILIDLLKTIKDVDLDFDLYVGATVQKEVGMRGATTATGLIQPDLGIVVDCLASGDYSSKEKVGKIGDGVLVTYYDKGMMPNRTLLNYLVNICEENEIKHQYYYSLGQNDSAWIHKLLSGCPTLNLFMSARGIHTGNTILDLNDVSALKKVLKELLISLNETKIENFKKDNR